jgi:hypothetical protein
VRIFCRRFLTPVVRRAEQFMRFHLMFILLPAPFTNQGGISRTSVRAYSG